MISQDVKITPALMQLFRALRLSGAGPDVPWKVGDMVSLHPDTRLERYCQIRAGRVLPAGLGAFSYSHSGFNTEMSVGRYCSLALGVGIIPGDHKVDWVTSSPITHTPMHNEGLALYLNEIGAREYRLHKVPIEHKPVTIGHDVWIGTHVLIKRGIAIGHGAIVGAGSIVTKDVPPYAIVAGSPARVLRYRFPEPLIERLLRSEWWRFGPEKLQPLDLRDPEVFLDGLEAAVADGLEPLILPVLTGQEIIAAGEPG